MSFVEFNNLGLGFLIEQLVNCHVLFELIPGALQMNGREIKLWCQSLRILLVLVSEPHLGEDWACNRYHEFGHRECLSAVFGSRCHKRLRVNLLSDPMEMSEDDSTL